MKDHGLSNRSKFAPMDQENLVENFALVWLSDNNY